MDKTASHSFGVSVKDILLPLASRSPRPTHLHPPPPPLLLPPAPFFPESLMKGSCKVTCHMCTSHLSVSACSGSHWNQRVAMLAQPATETSNCHQLGLVSWRHLFHSPRPDLIVNHYRSYSSSSLLFSSSLSSMALFFDFFLLLVSWSKKRSLGLWFS